MFKPGETQLIIPDQTFNCKRNLQIGNNENPYDYKKYHNLGGNSSSLHVKASITITKLYKNAKIIKKNRAEN